MVDLVLINIESEQQMGIPCVIFCFCRNKTNGFLSRVTCGLQLLTPNQHNNIENNTEITE